MTIEVRNWLPRSAFNDDSVRDALGDLFGNWSRRWSVRKVPAIAALRFLDGNTNGTASAGQLRFHGARAIIHLPARGKRALLEAMLDLDLSQKVLAEADRKVLDTVAGEAAEDLLAALETQFASEPVGHDKERIAIALALGSTELLTIVLAPHLFVRLIKERLDAAPASAAPARREVALKPLSLSLKAVLGRAELAMSDLNDLNPGDVLVLDRSVKAPVDLCLREGEAFVARGRLVRNGDRVSIQL